MKKIAFLIALAAFAPAAGAAYKCVDEKGRTHIGDTPPAGCANVMLYEVTRSGKVIREIPPTMTEEQVKARAEAQKRQAAEAKAAAEQKRKDMALMATYATEGEFDVVRDRTIAPIEGRKKVAQARIGEVDKRRQKIEEELEFYKAGKRKGAKSTEPPGHLVSELERLAAERAGLEKSIAGYEHEVVELRERFEHDKQRWIAIRHGGRNPAPAPATVQTSGRKN